jgi:Fic family protein
MDMKEINRLLEKFHQLNIPDSIDWEKFNHYAIVHHSTSIEGSTLTELETQLLLDENLTAKGKSFDHHLQVKDHYQALLFTLVAAKKQIPITVSLIQNIAEQVMKNTGSVRNTVIGSFDSSKGEFRLGSVTVGNKQFVDYKKVPGLMDRFCSELENAINKVTKKEEALILSFDAHYNLVTIHPFGDGNGRTARLLMNYVQHRHGLPLAKVFYEDRLDYFKALIDTREKEDLNIFRKFMLNQYGKMLNQEIEKAEKSKNIKLKKA